jgi:c-di-GMP-binding flagellar brake protein YcgR
VQDERRQFHRVVVDVPITLVVTGRRGPLPARLDNVSEGGCFFAADIGLKTGWQVSLSFMLSRRRLCSAMGTIVREASGSGFGVEFANVNEALRAFISSLVQATDEERPKLVAEIADGEIHIG